MIAMQVWHRGTELGLTIAEPFDPTLDEEQRKGLEQAFRAGKTWQQLGMIEVR